MPLDEDVVSQMGKAEGFLKYLGQEKHYSNYLEFFHRQMKEKGEERVLGEYLFSDSGGEVTELMLGRLFGGINFFPSYMFKGYSDN